MSQTRTDAILDVAEAGIRKGGFDAVSFRDIAAEVGIKSASVHYHFPQKSDLGRAVVARYGARLLEAIGDPAEPADDPRARLRRLTQAYRGALAVDGATCLCAVLGAVTQGLPEPVRDEIGGFYDRLLAWTRAALSDAEHRLSPEMVVATLMGAMILAVERGRPEILEDAERQILNALPEA